MTSYEEARVKLTNTQLNKSKSAETTLNNTGTTVKVTIKNFQDEEMPDELLLTRQKTKKDVDGYKTW